MKKGIFSMAVLAAMCVGGYFGHSAYQESKLTDLELANVEALSDGEVPCTEIKSGYRKWYVNGNLDDLMKFRDCCGIEQTGYDPSEHCM